MKIQNPTKLDIFFQGGGIIKFPVKNLKQIDIEPIDGDGGGSDEEPAELTKLDVIKNYVNLLYDNYNIEFDIVEETYSYEEPVMNENFEPTGEIITVTTKNYKFVPKTNVPRVYLNENITSGSISSGGNNGLTFHNTISTDLSANGIYKIMLDDTELTVLQLINYDIVQVGVAKLQINVPNNNIMDYAGYLEYLNWIRNNALENAEIPILLYGEPASDATRSYYNLGFITSELFLNGNKGYYKQTVYEAIEGDV